jgi:NhaA family Na+:H+ antiporter
MCIFITLLAFNQTLISHAKFVILLSSLTAGIVWFLSLKKTLKANPDENIIEFLTIELRKR